MRHFVTIVLVYLCCWRYPWENRRGFLGLLCRNEIELSPRMHSEEFCVCVCLCLRKQDMAQLTSAAHLVKGGIVAEVGRVVQTGFSFQRAGQARLFPVFCQPAAHEKNTPSEHLSIRVNFCNQRWMLDEVTCLYTFLPPGFSSISLLEKYLWSDQTNLIQIPITFKKKTNCKTASV